MSTALDHIAVAAATLEEGVAWVSSRLGVSLCPGGTHPLMGTHNRLLRLGEAVYLEVIAADPAIPTPPRQPRWFGLDEPQVQNRLRQHGPGVIGWIVRSDDIATDAARALVDVGRPERLSRGALEWLFTLSDDGALPAGGALPPLIEWPADFGSPASRLQERGCTFQTLKIGHPDPIQVARALDAIGLDRSMITIAASERPEVSVAIRLASGELVTLPALAG